MTKIIDPRTDKRIPSRWKKSWEQAAQPGELVFHITPHADAIMQSGAIDPKHHRDTAWNGLKAVFLMQVPGDDTEYHLEDLMAHYLKNRGIQDTTDLSVMAIPVNGTPILTCTEQDRGGLAVALDQLPTHNATVTTIPFRHMWDYMREINAMNRKLIEEKALKTPPRHPCI